MHDTFFQLAIVLALASFLGIVLLRLKLPLVIAYLISGVLLSGVQFLNLGNSVVFEVLPEIGIAFVLFLIGMELNLDELKALGRPIIGAAIGQIIISTLLGYSLAHSLGMTNTESFYLGVGLAFSSTVVVIKMLLESRDLTSLYGKLSVGILLIEDMAAVTLLMLISLGNFSLENSSVLLVLAAKAAGLFLLTFVLSKFVLKKIFEITARSVELLYVTAITWCFMFTSLAKLAGFSVEIGAFLAGVALASSPYHLQIQAKIKPLRDFFLTLFFIYLGTKANVKDFVIYWPAILLFTGYAVVVKPFIYLTLLSRFGFRKHTLFQTALNLSQVSEFSLVVILVGINAGILTTTPLSIMAAAAVLSITISSILISESKALYKEIGEMIKAFEHKGHVHSIEHTDKHALEDHIVVIGAHRVGKPITEYLTKNGIPFVVMDFNPTIVNELKKEGIHALYGDISDPEVLEELQLEKAKLIICTASDIADNELLMKIVKEKNASASIVLRATDTEHAQLLKNMGADYVIVPEKVSGDYIVSQLKHTWPKIHFSDNQKVETIA